MEIETDDVKGVILVWFCCEKTLLVRSCAVERMSKVGQKKSNVTDQIILKKGGSRSAVAAGKAQRGTEKWEAVTRNEFMRYRPLESFAVAR